MYRANSWNKYSLPAISILIALGASACGANSDSSDPQKYSLCMPTHLVEVDETASMIVDEAAKQIPGEQPAKTLSDKIGGLTAGSIIDICYSKNDNSLHATVITYGNIRNYSTVR